MKNRLLVTGIWALVLILGMTVIGCNNPANGGNGDDDDENLPKSSGNNAVSGRTYYEGYGNKIVFSTTADGDESGTYTVGIIAEDRENGELILVNGKYTYIDIENGTYSWNEGAKTVTLKPEKVSFLYEEEFWNPVYGPLLDKTAYRNRTRVYVESWRDEMGKEAFYQQLLSEGFSSETDYIDDWVNDWEHEAFSNTTYGYSFSKDKTALFLEQSLPVNRGENELSGQTYYGLTSTWDENEENWVHDVKDESQTYVFTASGYTFSAGYPWDTDNTETGSYAYDSNRKWVWLRPKKINGEDRAAWYAEQTVGTQHYFADDNAYRAAQINDWFRLWNRPYNSTDKTIGW